VSAFEAALQRAGFAVRVEVRAGLVLLIPREGHTVISDEQRRALVALTAEHGFTHVALELVD